MIKEITTHETFCDCCGKRFEYPGAIVGSWDPGWLKTEDYDLCDICAGLIKIKLLEEASEEKILEKVEELKEEKAKNPFNPVIGGACFTNNTTPIECDLNAGINTENGQWVNGTWMGYSKVT